MSKEPDFNIDEYEISELLDIFNITQPVQKEAIMKIASEFIGKYRQLEQSEYVEFFSKAMNKLISNYHQVEGILGKVDAILDDAIETKQNIKQTVEDLQERAEDMYEDAQEIAEDLYEEVQDRASGLIDKAEDILDNVQDTAEDIIEEGVNAYNDAKKITSEFLNPKVEDAGPNILRNRYYNGQTGPERAANLVMPPRGNYISVPNDPGVGTHAAQLQQRLMMPNAFAQIPFMQGYRNPTLQNVYLSWVNVDSQYREIKPSGNKTVDCSKNAVISNNIYQNDSPTDFLYNLQTPITNVLGMTIGSVEIPLSGYYAFSDKYGNTTFEVLIDSEPITCLRIPEGNYDASAIMQIVTTELKDLWIELAAKGKIPSAEPYPSLFIDESNQKSYFAFWPKNPSYLNSINLSFRWYEKSRCGCCKDCCNRNANIEQFKKEIPIPYRDENPGEIHYPKEYNCSDNNTGKKLNSTLGWSLGFRQYETPFELVSTILNPVADASLNEIDTTNKTYFGMFGSCVWNSLGTKYFILEIDDFNKNRNSGTMGTMTMPSSTEKFKMPAYAKELSQIYPVCREDENISTTSSVDNVKIGKHPDFLPEAERGNSTTGQTNKNQPLEFTTNTGTRSTKGYYENFKRACRKGTPAEKFAVKGQDTLTKAQKYTAREIRNTQKTIAYNQYYAPQASNILFRFPVQRLSTNLQVPLIVPNSAGMDNGRRYFGPVTIEKLRVRLLDDKGNPADFHCADISFSLIMERLYQY